MPITFDNKKEAVEYLEEKRLEGYKNAKLVKKGTHYIVTLNNLVIEKGSPGGLGELNKQ